MREPVSGSGGCVLHFSVNTTASLTPIRCDRVGDLPEKRRTALDLETAGLIFGAAAILLLIASAARRHH